MGLIYDEHIGPRHITPLTMVHNIISTYIYCYQTEGLYIHLDIRISYMDHTGQPLYVILLGG